MSAPVDVLAELLALAAYAPRDEHMNRLVVVRDAVAELIEASKAVDHALQHSGHFGVMEAVTRMQHALANCGDAP